MADIGENAREVIRSVGEATQNAVNNLPIPENWSSIISPKIGGIIDWSKHITSIGGIGSMFSPKIRVSTEELQRKAEEVDVQLAKMKSEFAEMSQIMRKTVTYWIGEAGNKYRNDYQKQYQEIQDMLKRLERFPRQLREIAGIYQEAESSNQTKAQALPADVL